MLTKKEFKKSIVDGIKAERLDPCNDVVFGEIYTDFPAYYWRIKDDEVTEGSPNYIGDEHPEFRFGISIGDVERYTEKDISELSDDEIKRALLDIVDEYSAVDDWYDAYLESLGMWG